MRDPHPASALATSGGWTYCSAVLPWKGSGGGAPWEGERHADRTAIALDTLLSALPTSGLVWGGDWNHALSGREHAGSIRGRAHLNDALTKLGLASPTAELEHQIPGLLSIDHIGVPTTSTVVAAERWPVRVDGRQLSDHDAYVVELATSQLSADGRSRLG